MEYMSVVQAAKELGLLPFDIHQLIRSGELTAEKPRRKWQVTRSSLEAFKKRHTVVGAAKDWFHGGHL